MFGHVGDQGHVGAVGVGVEPLGQVLAQHRGREGAKRFTVLDLEVERPLHGRGTRIAQDRARAQGARPELHAPLEPADRPAGRELVHDARD